MHFKQSRWPLSVNACLYWIGLARLHMVKRKLGSQCNLLKFSNLRPALPSALCSAQYKSEADSSLVLGSLRACTSIRAKK